MKQGIHADHNNLILKVRGLVRFAAQWSTRVPVDRAATVNKLNIQFCGSRETGVE